MRQSSVLPLTTAAVAAAVVVVVAAGDCVKLSVGLDSVTIY